MKIEKRNATKARSPGPESGSKFAEPFLGPYSGQLGRRDPKQAASLDARCDS